MTVSLLNEQQLALAHTFLTPFESANHLKDWCFNFLGIDFPIGYIDPESNSSPSEWLYDAYCTIRDNKGYEAPTFTVVSSRDSYKCTVKGTLILSKDKGLVPIENIIIGDTVWSGKSWRQVTDWVHDGIKKGKTVTLQNGINLTTSPIHRVWAWKKDKDPQWIKVSDLTTDDYVMVDIDSGYVNSEINLNDFNDGYFLGLLIGDGCLSLKDDYNLFFLTTIDENIKKFFFDQCYKRYGKFPRVNTDTISYSISSVKACRDLDELGVTNSYSFNKKVPHSCLKNKSAMIGFISGLFDTDGTWNSKNTFEIPITSESVLRTVQSILVALGVRSKFWSNSKLYSNQKHIVHHLRVNQNEMNKLFDAGLNLKASKKGHFILPKTPDSHDSLPLDFVKEFLDFLPKTSSKKRIGRKPSIGGQKNDKLYKSITYYKLHKTLKWAIDNKFLPKEQEEKWTNILNKKWVKVREVKDVENADFYDLTVDEDHSYWSNGIISHNTLSCSALEVISMVHFGLTVAHMAAIKPQSAKSIEYINTFLRKLEPYLAHYGRQIISKNTSNISISDPTGNISFISVVVCTMAGANSQHCSLFVCDEIDVVMQAAAYYEAKMIPGMLNGRYPLTVLTSTRKFAFGLFQKEIELAQELGTPIKKWNILDVTEYCDPKRHQPKKAKKIRYIAKRLPLKHISEEEYSKLLPELQDQYEKIKAHAGCASCELLSVCKTKLSTRPSTDVGGLYKPIPFTIGQFKKTSPDLAEAQLLCLKPSSTGLVYPRFSAAEGENLITLEQAWEFYTGNPAHKGIILNDLISVFHQKGIKFYAGVDWGYRHNYAISVGAILPNGDFWIFETFAMSGLEFSDQLKYAIHFRDKYKPVKWFADTAMPSSIATFRKNKMPCKDFKKDVLGGIESVRGQIVDATGRRRLKVIKTKENEILVKGFNQHHFKLNAAGDPTTDPDDEEFSDIMDEIRYLGQNLFSTKGKVRVGDESVSEREAARLTQQRLMYGNSEASFHGHQIAKEIHRFAVQGSGESKGKASGLVWDFSDPLKD